MLYSNPWAAHNLSVSKEITLNWDLTAMFLDSWVSFHCAIYHTLFASTNKKLSNEAQNNFNIFAFSCTPNFYVLFLWTATLKNQAPDLGSIILWATHKEPESSGPDSLWVANLVGSMWASVHHSMQN